MANVTITLSDLGDELVISAEFDPPPSNEAIQTHSPELTIAQHTALHLMEMLGGASRELQKSSGGSLIGQKDDPRYKL